MYLYIRKKRVEGMKRTVRYLLMAFILLCACSMPVYGDGFEMDDAMVGLYKEHGYINEYLGYQIDLPDDFILISREDSALDPDVYDADGNILNTDEDVSVVDASNSESTMSLLKLKMISTVFQAVSPASGIFVVNEGPGLRDQWEKEEYEIAEDKKKSMEMYLQEKAESEGTSPDYEVTSAYLGGFLNGSHHAVMFKYTMDGTRYYRMIIPLLSSDNKILSEIDFRSTDPYQMEKIYNCISTYTPDA